jgi:single-stranded DNA-binding protein
MGVNVVMVSGVVQNLALRYDEQSRPELRFVLQQTEQTASGREIKLYLPCTTPGSAAERLASELEEGTSILVTSGKLVYRKRDTKLGEQSRLEILVWAIEPLTTSSQAMTSPGSVAPEPSAAATVASDGEAGTPKPRWPRHPKWRPAAESPN